MRHQLALRQILAHHAGAGADDHATAGRSAHRELVHPFLQPRDFGLRPHQCVVRDTSTHGV